MAGSIKGITVKIGGDTTGLDKALKDVNTQIRDTQSELREVEKLLKLDPTNTELLKQKQELLAKSVKDTSDKLKTLKEAEKQAQAQFKEGKISEEQYRALEREIIKTEQSLKTLESQAAKSNATLNKIGNTAANVANKTKVISTAAAGTLTGIGAAATAFEDDFAKVSTLLDKSTVDYEDYKKTILEASSSTGIAAGEFSDATYQALSAGIAAKDAVDFTTIAAKLAKGGMTDAASAVDIITTALNAYGMKASEAEHVSDVLVQIQNKGKTTVSELASNMGRAIPTANAYGVSLEQLGAAYSIITSKGVATAESTTYISAMLNELGKSGTKASTELEEATGKSFSQLISEGQSLGDVIKILSDRAKRTGLSLNDMFGSAEAGKAALTLAADGAENFNNAVKGMEESAGTAQEAYEKIAGTPLEKAKKSLNEAKNSMIEAGQNMLPTIAEITKLISKATSAFSEMSPATQKVALGAIALTAAISPTAKVIQGLTTITGTAKAALKKLRDEKAKNAAASYEQAKAEQAAGAAAKASAANMQSLTLATNNSTNAKLLSAGGSANSSKGLGFGAFMSKAVSSMKSNPYVAAAAIGTAAEIAVIKKFYDIYEKEQKAAINGINARYDDLIEKSNKVYDSEIQRLEDLEKSRNNTHNARLSEINKEYDEAIKTASEYQEQQKNALKNEKKSLQKAHKEKLSQIEKEKKASEKFHKEKLSQIEKERDLKLSALDSETDSKTAALQAEIDALDAESEVEEKAKQEQENAQKLEELKRSIDSAKTYAEKVDAENNYTAELKRQEEERTKNAREEQKKQLQNQISQIKSESENKKQQINSEFENYKAVENEKYEIQQQNLESFKEAENEKYTVQQENLEARLSALDSYLESESERLENERQNKLSILQQETEDYCSQLQSQIDKQIELQQQAQKTLEAKKALEEEDAKPSLSDFFNPKKFKEQRSGSKGGYTFWNSVWSLLIGANAKGTNDWRGGLTYVHEQGAELINLPQHTQIIPHDLSVEYMRELARQKSATNNTYNYGAQQQVNVFSIDGKEVTEVIEPRVSVKMSNDIYGRRRSGGAR